MAGFNYARMQQTVIRLLSRFGPVAGATLIKPGVPTGPSFDPTPGVPVNYTCSAVILDYTINQVDNTNILASDKRILAARPDMSISPDPSWSITVKGTTYRIMAPTRTTAPGDVNLMWDLQCRI